jgi:hypothetical protein
MSGTGSAPRRREPSVEQGATRIIVDRSGSWPAPTIRAALGQGEAVRRPFSARRVPCGGNRQQVRFAQNLTDGDRRKCATPADVAVGTPSEIIVRVRWATNQPAYLRFYVRCRGSYGRFKLAPSNRVEREQRAGTRDGFGAAKEENRLCARWRRQLWCRSGRHVTGAHGARGARRLRRRR